MTKDNICCRKITVSSADHGKMLMEGLWSFFRTQHRTDCDLLLDQKSIRSHRIILDIFLSSRKLDSTTEAPSGGSSTDLLDGSSCILNVVLEFLYKGIVVIPEERRDELLEAAKKLDCTVLVNAIETCATKNCDGLSGIELANERGDTKVEVPCNDENFEHVIQSTGPLIRDARGDDCRHEAESVFEPLVELLEPKVELHSDSEDQQSFMFEFGTGDDDRWCVQGDDAKTELRVGESRLMNSEDDGYSLNSGAGEGMDPLSVSFSGIEGCALGGRDFQQDAVDANYNLVRKMRKSIKVPPKMYNCVRCEYESPKRPCYYRHLKSVHGVTARGKPAPKHKCSECDYESITLEHVVRHHKTTHQKKKQFKCSYCTSTFSLKNNLESHMDVVHDLGPSLYSCSTCCLRCGSQADLVRHQRIHNKEKPFKCKDCGMMFRHKKDQGRHWDVFHSSGPNRYTCETCHKRCGSQSQLVNHTRTHTKERPFQCPNCEYAGSRRDSLKSHLLRVHKIDLI